MNYNITFYCPDRHILYDGGRLPDKKGVGGGVTVRIRMAHTLALRGHRVTMICNCIREEIDRDVHYIPLDKTSAIDTDILIITTSGDGLNLHHLQNLEINSKIRILLSHGIDKPQGLKDNEITSFYAISNFVRNVMLQQWGISRSNVFVSYHGVLKESFKSTPPWYMPYYKNKRNDYRLAYLGHPHKGREAALGVLGKLREVSSQYHIHLFGDERLWGGNIKRLRKTSGVKNFGLVNQGTLAQQLLLCNFGLFLQAREEPFGITLIETMTAGCIPIASPVGAFQELIHHGVNGFLIEGDHNSPKTWQRVTDLIVGLQKDPEQLEVVRERAKNWVLSWQEVAQTWEEHWQILLDHHSISNHMTNDICMECNSAMLKLTDGWHCFVCGNFTRRIGDI